MKCRTWQHAFGRIFPLLVAGMWSGMVGCKSNETDSSALIGASEPTQKERPRVEVTLPQSPSFEKKHAPKKYPDGHFSVYGVREDIKETADKNVSVKGTVIGVYECPPCPKGAECKPCAQPHLWLADDPETPREKALLVVDLPEKRFKVEPGGQYVFTGAFAINSASGFKSSTGLLVYGEHQAVEGK